jgi:endonuclease-3
MPAFPVDTHVYRVSGRLGLRPKQMNIVNTHEFLESIFQKEVYAAAHLNIIRLGRELCQARKMICDRCPLNELCETVKNR